MNQNNQVIQRILDIIGYSDNKQVFEDKFIKACQQQALLDLVNSLPTDKQASLKQQLGPENDPQKIGEILKQYVSADDYDKTLRLASQTALDNYLQTVTPTLSDTQSAELQSYLKSLNPQSGVLNSA